MDFFASRPATQEPASFDTSNEDITFAQAVGRRFSGAATASLLTSRLEFPAARPLATSIPQVPMPLSTPLSNLSLSSPQGAVAPNLSRRRAPMVAAPGAARFTAVEPEGVSSLLALGDILVIDIRPHAQHVAGRLPGALSLTVPSTLLKRSGFDLEKISTMLSDDASRSTFLRWKSAKRILAYDTDSALLTENNHIFHLLRKFQVAGYTGDLYWLKGGVAALSKSDPSVLQALSPDRGMPHVAGDGLLQPGHLPAMAFQQSSTTLIGQAHPLHPQPATEPSTSLTVANPFYDNIRQNSELSEGVGVRIPLQLTPGHDTPDEHLQYQWMKNLLDYTRNPEEGAEALATQFYRIEIGEQRRMQGIMNHHSQESSNRGPLTAPAQFPYSITAGIEMGAKNRYRNIWPFEHARVRLRTKSALDGSDYVNASFVQPMVTSRRYIATQGPLATTFNDFWTICWEQKVPVIVMLTREVEGNLVKCGKYWKDGVYGPYKLKLDKQEGDADEEEDISATGGFGFTVPANNKKRDVIVKRYFSLAKVDQPHLPPRKIVHLQYLGWPDMNVPDSAQGVLQLVREVNTAIEAESSARDDEPGPIMLHCSAGVGRTGGYILIDSILDGLKRDLSESDQQRQGRNTRRPSSSDLMELDTDLSSSATQTSWAPEEHIRTGSSQRVVIHGHQGGSFMNPGAIRAGSNSSSVYGEASSLPDSSSGDLSNSLPSTRLKPKRLLEALAEKSVKASATENPPVSNAVQFNAWSAALDEDQGVRRDPEEDSPPLGSSRSSPPHSHGSFYKKPRVLHDHGDIKRISDLDVPIQQVLEDMREQRMSLVQSLRQYVFAHRVILEGAIQMIQEHSRVQAQRLQPRLKSQSHRQQL